MMQDEQKGSTLRVECNSIFGSQLYSIHLVAINDNRMNFLKNFRIYLAPRFSFFGVSTGEIVLELEELELEHSRLSSAHATFLKKVKDKLMEKL
jgi:hypothetical protein